MTILAGMEVTGLVVEGYKLCRCGAWLTTEEAERSNLCWDCRAALNDAVREGIEIEVDGVDVQLPRYVRPTPAPSKTNPEYRRLYRRAQTRAWRRLAQIDRPLFQLLFDQEKARVGLVASKKRPGRRPLEVVPDAVVELVEDHVARQERTLRADTA